MSTADAVRQLIESKGLPLSAKDAVLAAMAEALAVQIDGAWNATEGDRTLPAACRELRSVVEQLAGPEEDELHAFVASLSAPVRDAPKS